MINSVLNPYVLFILAGIILFIPNCKQSSYNPKPLEEITLQNSSLQIKDDISIQCKLLTKQESHKLFNGRGSRLLNKRRPLYPLYLSITNNGTKRLLLDPACIGLKLINAELVAQRLFSHTARKIVAPLLVGTIGAGTIFIASAYISILGAIASIPSLVKTGYAGLGIAGILAIGTPFVCYHQANEAIITNTRIHEDVMSKSLHKPTIIEPKASLMTLLFVPRKCYNSFFNIHLIDVTSQQSLPYNVTIEEGELPCKK